MTVEAKVVELRRHVIQRVAAGVPVRPVCREAGINPTLFYAWKRRYVRYGDAVLHPSPARPTRWGRQSSPALEHGVLAYALQCPTHGPQQISDQLRPRERFLPSQTDAAKRQRRGVRAAGGARPVGPVCAARLLRLACRPANRLTFQLLESLV